MPYSDDPVADFHRHDAELNKRLRDLPVCGECGHHIQDGFAYEYNDEPICTECLNANHLKAIEYFM